MREFESFKVTYTPIFKCFEAGDGVIFALRYDPGITSVMPMVIDCLTRKNTQECLVVFSRCLVVFVHFFHFLLLFFYYL